jgi:hypothetical protein
MLQLLSFEISDRCNLASAHSRCPCHLGLARYSHLDTSHLLDDATIIETARRFYREFGFRGMIAWHYYNEPLLQAERMFGLIARIRCAVPESRFLLWTNGTLLPADCSAFAAFAEIHVTDYGGANPPRNLDALRATCPRVIVERGNLDGRLAGLGEPADNPCKRPYTEFGVDAYGNCHLCCVDWRGLASQGNVLRDGLDACVSKWAAMAGAVCGDRMTAEAPEACRRCPRRYGAMSGFG